MPHIYLSEEEIIRIMRKETAIKKKIGNLIDSMLCDDSQISAMDNIKNKKGLSITLVFKGICLIASLLSYFSEGMSM